MAYQLHPDEPLAEGFKRIAEEQFTSAILQLQSPKDLGARVYAMRKALKKARSLLRLLAPLLGPVYTEENRRLRDIARRFSSLRDANVSLQVLETFQTAYKRKSTLNSQRKALLDKHNSLHQIDWQIAIAESLELLQGARKRIEDWPIKHLTHESLIEEMRKTQKQSRHALLHARKKGTAEAFHEFRKSLKRELNQIRLVDRSDPKLAHFKKLSTLLGDHHNLAVLLASLTNTSGRFNQLATKQLKSGEKQILTLAAELYGQVLSINDEQLGTVPNPPPPSSLTHLPRHP